MVHISKLVAILKLHRTHKKIDNQQMKYEFLIHIFFYKIVSSQNNIIEYIKICQHYNLKEKT